MKATITQSKFHLDSAKLKKKKRTGSSVALSFNMQKTRKNANALRLWREILRKVLFGTATINGIIISFFFFNFSSSVFQVFYSASSSDLSKDVGLNTSTSLLHLKPYTRYKVEVQAFTGAGGGKKTGVFVKTDETGMFLILALKGSMSTYIFFRLIFIHIFEELIQENVSKDQEMFPFGDLFINSHEHFS